MLYKLPYSGNFSATIITGKVSNPILKIQMNKKLFNK